jgi:hypothetical protein
MFPAVFRFILLLNTMVKSGESHATPQSQTTAEVFWTRLIGRGDAHRISKVWFMGPPWAVTVPNHPAKTGGEARYPSDLHAGRSGFPNHIPGALKPCCMHE